MREIKFKAWVTRKETNQQGWYEVDFTDSSNIGVLNVNFDYVLCQFTGLYDKKGKEIYEGDVVVKKDFDWYPTDLWDDDDERWLNPEYHLEEEELMRDVVTMNRFPCFWLKNEYFGYEGEGLICPKECEIIGNIYENPELLK